ncbi:unnamed protein product [Arabis nemorensis]|uniref:Uncharacterized protein n=1 Tax=Arabis nemorensis TaxID=586526 RepID=A0A565BTV0_9BRAS|nr:unnamed protein product [Arabis nemorensis]
MYNGLHLSISHLVDLAGFSHLEPNYTYQLAVHVRDLAVKFGYLWNWIPGCWVKSLYDGPDANNIDELRIFLTVGLIGT